ncbi:aldo/keto reductase [Haliea sp. E17]|uniref:aldo/keto reductase n=1 Tax=Haliea sp. E17 TaxID=3401576 RepID=UPI003AAD419C
MQYKRLGRTGLIVSGMCLGTNTFGGAKSDWWKTFGGLDQAATDAVMAAAFEAGINFIDTADRYADGESEERVAQGLKNLAINRADMVIAAKGGLQMQQGPNGMGGSRGYLMRALEATLRRLDTDYVDVYMIHLFDAATPLEETVRTLDAMVRSGKVRYIGCSNFASWQVMKGLKISAEEHLERFQVVEAQWSAATRGIERELIPLALDQELGIMVWGPLLGGLLSGKYTRDGGGAGEGRTGGNVPAVIGRDQLFDVVDALRIVAGRREATVAQCALAWVMRQKGASTVLFGARSPEQVEQNVKAAEIQLEAEDIALISAAAEPVMDYGIWSVRGSADSRLPYV